MELLALHTRRRRAALLPHQPPAEPERKRVCKSLEPIPNESDFCHQLNECAMDYWTMELDSKQKDFSKSWKQRYCPALPKMYCRRIWTLQPYYGLLEGEPAKRQCSVSKIFKTSADERLHFSVTAIPYRKVSLLLFTSALERLYYRLFSGARSFGDKKTLDCFKIIA
ncbi:uncharacterized protein LOC119859291 [Dermochelys coriacea]|uniref:uncharacterized protein LOC119859291 n=1 Tax=Dermochelys coriacea TaxID=27794 RepID=UPI001CA82E00|nr:uncharacterized protein LOC119859291 [Dermochelys coriacea]